MTYHPIVLADSGFLFAYYSAKDKYHGSVESTSCWWIEIPEKKKLDITAKNAFVELAGESKDFSKEIQNLWAMNQELSNASCLAFAISKSEVMSESLSTLRSMIKKLKKTRR